MGSPRPIVLLVGISLLACKREPPEAHGREPAPVSVQVAPKATAEDAAAADPVPMWYRARITAADGIEASFFLGVPPAGKPGQVIFKVGPHEVRGDATFDGTTLKAPLPVHQTDVEATIAGDGTLTGTFSSSWRAVAASSLPLTGTKVAAPDTAELATMGTPTGAALDLHAPRTVWRITMKDSGAAKLVIDQVRPGVFEGRLFMSTGNINYLAGNGAGDALTLSGFDGTAGYRVELAFDATRATAHGTFAAGNVLDWRETITATQGPEFVLALRPKPVRPGVKIGLPQLPELAALEPGPMVIEIGGSWCSTCRNAAPYLAELYRAYQPRGLRMLTLLYDFTDDKTVDAQQAATYRKAYGASWPVVPVSGPIEDLAKDLPKGISDIDPGGFPITLFVAADRTLIALHAGFPAADATDEFNRVDAEFRAHIEAMLATPAPR